ncbi:MAG: helix-turn-helix domain-containing protein [Bacteriovoracia bacterium]
MTKPRRKRIESPFHKNFDRILKERDLNLKQAAKLMGVPYSTLASWGAEKSIPSDLSAIGRFCKLIGVDFEWLLTGEPSRALDNSKFQIEDLFVEEDVGLEGLFKIKAVKLSRKKGNLKD